MAGPREDERDATSRLRRPRTGSGALANCHNPSGKLPSPPGRRWLRAPASARPGRPRTLSSRTGGPAPPGAPGRGDPHGPGGCGRHRRAGRRAGNFPPRSARGQLTRLRGGRHAWLRGLEAAARAGRPRGHRPTPARRTSGAEPPGSRPAPAATPGTAPAPKTKARGRRRAARRAEAKPPAAARPSGTGGARPAALPSPGAPRANKAAPDLQGRAGGGRSGDRRPPPAGPRRQPAAARPASPRARRRRRSRLRPRRCGLRGCPPAPGPAGRPRAPSPRGAPASVPHASCGSGGGGGGFARSWDCAAVTANNAVSHWPSPLSPPSPRKVGCDWSASAQVNYAPAPRAGTNQRLAALRPRSRRQILRATPAEPRAHPPARDPSATLRGWGAWSPRGGQPTRAPSFRSRVAPPALPTLPLHLHPSNAPR